MIVICKTPNCANYGVPIEENIDSTGFYCVSANKVCDLCGNERIYDKELNYNEPSFNIDEIALGTKRLFEKPSN